MARLWIGRGDQGAWTYYVLAEVHLTRGEMKAAVRSLERAVELGARDYHWMRNFAVFAPLHDHPGFRALLDRVKSDVDRMRGRVEADD